MTNGMGPDSFTSFTTGGSSRDDRAPWQRPDQEPRRPVGGIGPASLGVALTLLLLVAIVVVIALLAR